MLAAELRGKTIRLHTRQQVERFPCSACYRSIINVSFKKNILSIHLWTFSEACILFQFCCGHIAYSAVCEVLKKKSEHKTSPKQESKFVDENSKRNSWVNCICCCTLIFNSLFAVLWTLLNTEFVFLFDLQWITRNITHIVGRFFVMCTSFCLFLGRRTMQRSSRLTSFRHRVKKAADALR